MFPYLDSPLYRILSESHQFILTFVEKFFKPILARNVFHRNESVRDRATSGLELQKRQASQI